MRVKPSEAEERRRSELVDKVRMLAGKSKAYQKVITRQRSRQVRTEAALIKVMVEALEAGVEWNKVWEAAEDLIDLDIVRELNADREWQPWYDENS